MNFKPLDTYKVLNEHKCSTSTFINWHITEVLRSIKRKLTLKRKYSDPFTVVVVRDIHKDVFYELFRCIRDFRSGVGIETKTERNKKGQPTVRSITFTHFGHFRYHAQQLTALGEDDVKNFLAKSFSCKSCAKVLATKENPITITFKYSTNTMTLKSHYVTKNVYGNVTSY